MKPFFLAFLTTLLLAAPSFASTVDELKKTEAELQQSKKEQAVLEAKQNKLEKELTYIQRRLVQAAEAAQKSETVLARAQDKADTLKADIDRKEKQLAVGRKNLAVLLQGALNLSQMPPEAMVLLPGGKELGKESMTAAAALRVASDSIRGELSGIEAQAEELKRLHHEAATHQEELADKRQAMGKDQQELQKKLQASQALKEQLGRKREEEEKRSSDLARKVADLHQLIAKASHASRPLFGWTADKMRSFPEAKGKLRPPVAGKLVQGYQKNKRGETSKGIVISAGTDRAQVVAPFDGQVIFSGPFLNYGKLVILKHSDGYHTLLAGLEDIDARSGDFLLEGEPIGAMGSSKSAHRLYFELRKDNQPVNPEPWLQALNKKY